MAAVAMIAAFGIIAPVSAATLYQYTGNNFTSVSDPSVPAGAYDTSMSISGSFLVADALTPMPVTDISASILEYTLFDGRTNLTHLNSTLVNASFAINASGDIITWTFTAMADTGGYAAVGDQSMQISTDNIFDIVGISECIEEWPTGGCKLSSQDGASVIASPGVWTYSTVVPIPAAAWLFGSALLGLGWMKRKEA